MKKLSLLLFLISSTLTAQIHTEVHLFDISEKDEKWQVTNGKNISNNKGYDSQPHFYDDNTILFSSTRNGQTDILKYNIKTEEKTFINNTPNGGEYSPQRIPNSKHISAVRLDNDGLQRFYQYNINTGRDIELIKDLVVAYPIWHNNNTLVSSVIVKDTLELFVSDLKNKTNISIAKQTGRSFHKIPNTNLISFMKKNDDSWEVWSLNPKSKETKKIVATGEMQDVCWLPNGNLLLANENAIVQYSPKENKWNYFYQFKDENINNISRITVNEDGSKLSIVAEISPKVLAQEQLDGYNNRDIDAFLKPYSKDVKVYTYPDKLNYQGIDQMRKRYTTMFDKTTDLHCKILSRIVNGNKIIDHEEVTANGSTFKAVAIYTVKNGKIAEVRFVR